MRVDWFELELYIWQKGTIVSQPGKTRQNPHVMSPNSSKLKGHLYPLSVTKGTLAFLSGPSLIMDWVVHNAELNFLKFVLMMKIFNDDDV